MVSNHTSSLSVSKKARNQRLNTPRPARTPPAVNTPIFAATC